MLKYSVIKNGVVTNSWTSEFADESHYESCFGKPERWVRAEVEDISGALETREVSSPSLDPEIPSVVTEYRLPAEYSVQIEDITASLAAEQAVANGMKAQQIGAQVIAIVWAINESKNLSGAEFQAMLADTSLQLIERLLWSGSLKTAKALIQTNASLAEHFTSEEIAQVLALINSSGLV